MPARSRELRELFFELGEALAERQRYGEAAAALAQALVEEAATPSMSDIAITLAHCRLAGGDPDGALEVALDVLVTAEPANAPVAAELAEALLPEADLPLHRTRLVDGRWPSMLASPALPATTRVRVGTLLGGALLQLDEPEAAERLLAPSERVADGDAAPARLHGRALVALGRFGEAASAFARALDASRRTTGQDAQDIAVERASALLASHQIEDALAALPDPLPTPTSAHLD